MNVEHGKIVQNSPTLKFEFELRHIPVTDFLHSLQYTASDVLKSLKHKHFTLLQCV